MNVNEILTKVNHLNKGVLAMILAGLLLLVIPLFTGVNQPENHSFSPNSFNLVLRQIGHQLLLQSGDSSSRVLPVKKLTAESYELRFEQDFGFMPDTLLRVIKQTMTAYDITTPYEVAVKACQSADVVYGFEIVPRPQPNKTAYKEIVPCLGREQPKACYVLQISFQTPSRAQLAQPGLLIFVISGLSCFVLAWLFGRRPKKLIMEPGSQSGLRLGGFVYVPDRQLLFFGQEAVALSDKENQLLALLANRLDELVSREELLKKVWEDEGVITGRSLDVFISRLRKKLQADPRVQLNNVHGRGYKLEILT
jgi:hypothetical protein